jgi:hypothetical protein
LHSSTSTLTESSADSSVSALTMALNMRLG